jgi:hypothetical protein
MLDQRASWISLRLAVDLGPQPKIRSITANSQTGDSSRCGNGKPYLSDEAAPASRKPREVRPADAAAHRPNRILFAFPPGIRVAKNARLNIDCDCFLMTARHAAVPSLTGADRSLWKQPMQTRPLETLESNPGRVAEVRHLFSPTAPRLPGVSTELAYLGAFAARPYSYMYEPPAGAAWQNCEYRLHPV